MADLSEKQQIQIRSHFNYIFQNVAYHSLSVFEMISVVVKYYESIIAYLPGNIYWFDKNARGVGCNINVLKMFNLKDISQFRNLTFEEMGKLGNWPESATTKFKQDTLNVIKLGKLVLSQEEPPIRDHNGNRIYYLTNRVPLFDADKNIIGMAGNSIDMTPLRLAEEQTKLAVWKAAEEKAKAETEGELRKAVTVWAGSIAHDLKVPLTSQSFLLHSLSYKLNEMNLAEEHHKTITEIFNKLKINIEEMNVFITSTLHSLKQVTTGEPMDNHLTRCDLEICLTAAVEKYPYTGNEKDLVHINITENFYFLGHEVFLFRIVFNLLKNSFEQIAKNKRGEIFITTEILNMHNIVRFKDTAGGASHIEISKFFKTFESNKTQGTGIGLPFCKLTMELMGGQLSYYSVEGDYIEFILSFPKV